ncbi:MAG: type II toxin-antitoxin system Phd/YefM family antitoxin [Clostridia bacterium]|nr:type II toxin-antitoxin system Phd/YefM family antitoxin [Clostridia bacterium]
MAKIRPVSDLRNKFPEIEQLVIKENQPVYLTKNGHGSMVIMSIDKYEELTENIESKLDEADKEAMNTSVRYTHEEVFDKISEKIHGRK